MPMRAEEGCLLAIDVGSTTTRCLLFDLEGRAVGEAYREPVAHHPRTTWTEVDPDDWWDAVAGAVREVLERPEVSGRRVLGVGLCGLQHALVPIGRDGRVLARSMLWMDQRCQPQVEWMNREHGALIEEVRGKGASVSTTFSAPKLRWIVENEPDLLRRTHLFLPVKDFIRFRLTGTVATDPSDAGSTFLVDPRTKTWSHRLLEVVGVSSEKMPPIQEATQVAGCITGEAARATGLESGVPVVTGGGDVICTRTGAGVTGANRACLYLGTAAWISMPPGRARGRSFGATATTGASLKWLAEIFGRRPETDPIRSYMGLIREAKGAPLGARGLIFLPHLMGERGPRYNPEAKGTLFGLTLAHGRGDIVRAVLEGCAFHLRQILEGLRPCDLEEMVAVGGGAKIPLWLDIIPDVTGVTLRVPRVLEAGALGAAILAGVGVGVYGDAQEAAENLVRIVGQHRADPVRHERYGRIYDTFLELEERVAPLYGRASACDDIG